MLANVDKLTAALCKSLWSFTCAESCSTKPGQLPIKSAFTWHAFWRWPSFWGGTSTSHKISQDGRFYFHNGVFQCLPQELLPPQNAEQLIALLWLLLQNLSPALSFGARFGTQSPFFNGVPSVLTVSQSYQSLVCLCLTDPSGSQLVILGRHEIDLKSPHFPQIHQKLPKDRFAECPGPSLVMCRNCASTPTSPVQGVLVNPFHGTSVAAARSVLAFLRLGAYLLSVYIKFAFLHIPIYPPFYQCFLPFEVADGNVQFAAIPFWSVLLLLEYSQRF